MFNCRLVFTKLLPIASWFIVTVASSKELEEGISVTIGDNHELYQSLIFHEQPSCVSEEDILSIQDLPANKIEVQRQDKDDAFMLLLDDLDDLLDDDEFFEDNYSPDLVLREAKQKAAKSAAAKPAAAPKPAPAPKPAKEAKSKQPQPSKAEKQKAANDKKAQDNAAKADKKAKAQAAKADKQKQKDQKLVKDNLALEKKAQDKAGVVAQKNLDNIKKKNLKDNANENKRYAGQERKLQQNLAKSEKAFASQKGRKGEMQASKSLAQAKAAMASVPGQHKARVDKIYQQSTTAMNKNRGNLDKSLTKAHTSQFDANGRAKEHLSTWQKFGQVMSYLGPAMLSFIPGVGTAMMGAMTAGRVAGAVAQTAAKEGVKQGVKTGGKQGAKQGTKQATAKEAAIDWRKVQPDQIKTSQLNKDRNINAYEAQRAQLAQSLRPMKRDVEFYDRLTPRQLYHFTRSVLLEDLVWDDFEDDEF